MIKRLVLVLLSFFPMVAYAVSEETENLRKIALHYLDAAWKGGLSSPYEHSLCWSTKTWPERYVKELYDYPSFHHGFHYLFWWCDASFEESIASHLETIQQYIKEKWPQEIISRKQKIVQDLRAKHPRVQSILHAGWADIHQNFKMLSSNWKRSEEVTDLFKAGLFYFEEGKTAKAVHLMEKIMDSGQLHQLLEDLQIKLRNFSIDLATGYNEVGLYEKALYVLNELIEKNPKCKEAYLQRAIAYFESGNFEEALEDYLRSHIKPKSFREEDESSLAFSLGAIKGLIKGGEQGVVDFIPSLLASANGIGHGLWAFASDPIHASADFIKGVRDILEYMRSNSTKKVLLQVVPEIKELVENWDRLSDYEQGEMSGYIAGKYGVDIFSGIGAVKAVKYYRNLKRANSLLTLEAMTLGENSRRLVHLEAISRAERRKQVLQHANLKIQWDKQGKHIKGHKNFNSQANRSIFDHPNPQKLIQDFSGKGIRIGNKRPGMPGYKEIVDFKEFIGHTVDPNTGKKVLTSWGKIHYAKDGVHIVPTNPRG